LSKKSKKSHKKNKSRSRSKSKNRKNSINESDYESDAGEEGEVLDAFAKLPKNGKQLQKLLHSVN